MNYYETITYDSTSGVFTWAIGRRGCRNGSVAGCLNSGGYRVIKLGRVPVLAHRLAWFFVNGEWPCGSIDHINGQKDDNRIDNLRIADHSINMQNKRSAMSNNLSCGLLGVSWNKQHNRWQSKLMVNKKIHHIGYFKSPEQAHLAYLEAKRILHPGCTI